MKTIQDALEKVLNGVAEQFVAGVVIKKISALGVTLSERERRQVAQYIAQNREGALTLRRWAWWDNRQISIDISPEDLRQIEQKFSDFLENHLPDMIDNAISEVAQRILANLKGKWSRESRLQRRDVSKFRKQLYKRWKAPLEGLSMLLVMARDFGDSISNEVRQSPQAHTQRNLVEVLTRSHARACQIAEEILCLLECDFADGAVARWRTLHEVSVVASFIRSNGEDLAERYVLHQAVESRRAAREYQACCQRLGFEPLEENEIKAIQDSYDAAVARFGPEFSKGDYGWAAHHLKLSQPSFKDLETAACVDHMRAYYRMASHNVHANPKGVFFRLGFLDESEVLLAGRSNAGLTDPGQCAALSLVTFLLLLVSCSRHWTTMWLF